MKAYDKQQDKLLWERWLTIYPFMESKKFKFISFEDYKKELLDKKFQTTNISNEEIEDEIMKVIALYERR